MKHTPGPWEAIGRGVYAKAGREIVFQGHMTRSAEEPEQRANARLIAAAPDLLKSLRFAISNLEMLAPELETAGRVTSVPHAIETARAAILAATGEDDDETKRIIADEEELREDWNSRRYRR